MPLSTYSVSLHLPPSPTHPILSPSASKSGDLCGGMLRTALSSPVSSSSKSEVLRKSKLSRALSTVRLRLDDLLLWPGRRHCGGTGGGGGVNNSQFDMSWVSLAGYFLHSTFHSHIHTLTHAEMGQLLGASCLRTLWHVWRIKPPSC